MGGERLRRTASVAEDRLFVVGGLDLATVVDDSAVGTNSHLGLGPRERSGWAITREQTLTM